MIPQNAPFNTQFNRDTPQRDSQVQSVSELMV